MMISEDALTAIHETGHAIANREIEWLERSSTSPGLLISVTVEPDAMALGRAQILPRLAHLDELNSPAEICRFRAGRRRLVRTRKARAALDRDVEADVVEVLAGPIAENRARLGRALNDREIADLSDYAASDTWLDELDVGGAVNDDIARIQRRMCWLSDGRGVDGFSLAERLVRRAVDLIGAGDDHHFQRLVAMAAILAERRSMDVDEFTSAWSEIRGKGAG